MQFRKLAFAFSTLLGVSALSVVSANQAHAQFSITPTFDSTWSADANATADEASIVSFYATNYGSFTNNVNMSVVISDVGFGLGTSITGIGTIGYSDYVDLLTADKTAGSDDRGGSAAFLNYVPTSNDPLGYSNVSISTAQFRALGGSVGGVVGDNLDPSITGKFDSHIEINVGLAQSDGYNIAALTGHETDEAMGLGSGLNSYNQSVPSAPNAISGEDLFRYSAPGVRNFSAASSTPIYFSLDNGNTVLEYFNSEQGADYQDWASDGEHYDFAPAVQDAFSEPNVSTNLALGPAEYAALNAIGWNKGISADDAVPEPRMMLVTGLFMLGMTGLGVIRGRRRRTRAELGLPSESDTGQ